MQKIATRLFIYSSIAFGVTGILMVITSPQAGETGSGINAVLEKILLATIFVILPSFALSLAGKYLSDKS